MNYRLAGKKTTVASHFKIQMNNSYQVLEKQINHYTGAVTIKEIKDIVKKTKDSTRGKFNTCRKTEN